MSYRQHYPGAVAFVFSWKQQSAKLTGHRAGKPGVSPQTQEINKPILKTPRERTLLL